MFFKQFCDQLEIKIQDSYTQGVTMEQAERLAGEFLHAMMRVSTELKTVDLDSRMRKSGVKAVRAAVYLDTVQSSDKKPTEAQITSLIDTSPEVNQSQDGLDKAEVDRDDLKRYYDIFQNAHVFFRGIAKGNFGG